MKKEILAAIGQLSVKMRLLKAVQSANSAAAELKDREILILELLASQGAMNVTELCKFFPGVAQSTISNDIKNLRISKGFVAKRFGDQDERVHIVELTPEGSEKVDEIKEQRIQLYIPLQEAIGGDESEIAILRRIVFAAIEKIDFEFSRIGNKAE